MREIRPSGLAGGGADPFGPPYPDPKQDLLKKKATAQALP
jgi:hypothetical protein